MANTKTTHSAAELQAKREIKKNAPVKEVANAVEQKSTKKTFIGTVVSDKMQKTVVISIERKVAHPKYGKLIKITKRFKADTNNMEIKTGDLIRMEETRPISRGKSFKVIEVIKEGGKK